MGNNSTFQYALQPVLLRRQWDIDDLTSDMSHLNDLLNKVQRECTQLQCETELVHSEWKNQSITSSNINAERFSSVLYYLDDLAKQLEEKGQQIEKLEVERESLIDRIILAQRSLDAIEQHRKEIHGRFLQERMNSEFRLADDHWSTLQIHKKS